MTIEPAFEMWIVLVCDRHTDPEPRLFLSEAGARTNLEETADEYRADGYEVTPYENGYAFGEEGDHAFLVPVGEIYP